MIIPRHSFKEAYQRIKDDAASVNNGCSLLIMVGADVDAICAARILVVRGAARRDGLRPLARLLCPWPRLAAPHCRAPLTPPPAPQPPR